ncbi:hypothetical protein [Halogeometricum salsisoli]|nr:hypothetical protein [Halogeometricum sp. S1BR25-6]
MGDTDAPPWRAALGTVAGYGGILLLMFVVLFLVPYIVVSVL